MPLVTQTVKNLPAMQETWVQSLGQEYPLEKGMAIHSSILAWRIPRTEETGRLQSMGSQRVRNDWVTIISTHSSHISLHMSTQCFFMCWDYINISSWFFLIHPWVSDQRSSFMPSTFGFLQLESFLLLCLICNSVSPSSKLSFNCLFLCLTSEHISSKLSRMCSTYLYYSVCVLHIQQTVQ